MLIILNANLTSELNPIFFITTNLVYRLRLQTILNLSQIPESLSSTISNISVFNYLINLYVM